AGNQVQGDRLLRFEDESMPYRDDWIEYRALRVRKRTRLAQRLRIGGAVVAADEAQTVGLERQGNAVGSVQCHQVQQPRPMLGGGTRPTPTQDRRPRAQDLGLDEKVAESTLRVVGRAAL